MRIVVVTGGFDPIHSGHISLFQEAKKLGDVLIVGLNSDLWLARKKGKPFMLWDERACVLENLEMVDHVIAFDDRDGTAIDAIKQAMIKYPNRKVIFANGGDRTVENIPELEAYRLDDSVSFVFGIGGEDKKNSSSTLLKNYSRPEVERPWGKYIILSHGEGFLTKEIIVNPKSSLSMQKHKDRSEHWVVVSGKIFINTINIASDYEREKVLVAGQSAFIQKGDWHQLQNPTDTEVKIIETWIGDNLTELDIERK